MPIIIEELEAEVRPERDDRGEDAPSATALPTRAFQRRQGMGRQVLQRLQTYSSSTNKGPGPGPAVAATPQREPGRIFERVRLNLVFVTGRECSWRLLF